MTFKRRAVVEQQGHLVVYAHRCKVAAALAFQSKYLAKKRAAAFLSRAGTMVWFKTMVMTFLPRDARSVGVVLEYSASPMPGRAAVPPVAWMLHPNSSRMTRLHLTRRDNELEQASGTGVVAETGFLRRFANGVGFSILQDLSDIIFFSLPGNLDYYMENITSQRPCGATNAVSSRCSSTLRRVSLFSSARARPRSPSCGCCAPPERICAGFPATPTCARRS